MRTPLLLTLVMLCGCTWTPAQARTANSILNGVACGVAAAQETPCTPQAVLDALARDTEAQRTKVAAVVPQAAAVDPALTRMLVEQLAANTASNAAVAKALVDLAARGQPLPQYPLTMEPMPALPRAPAVLPLPSPPPPVPPPPAEAGAQPAP